LVNGLVIPKKSRILIAGSAAMKAASVRKEFEKK
jgi:hypothetical protein